MSVAIINNNITTVQGSFASGRTVIADGQVVKDPILPVAKVGTLTTRTSNVAGTLTMAAGHGITTGQRLDIFFTGGAMYGALVGTVAGDSVPFTAAVALEGSVLPAAASAVTVMVPPLESFPVTFANLRVLIMACTVPAIIVFIGAASAVIKAEYISGPTDTFAWDGDSGAANPFTADTVSVYLSHGSSTLASKVSAIAHVL